MSASLEPKASYIPTNCPYCGDSPVNHFVEYIGSSLEIIENKIGRSRILQRLFLLLNLPLEKLLFQFLVLVRIGRFEKDISSAATLRSRMIWIEAARRGIEMEQFTAFGKGTDWFRAQMAGRYIYFHSLPIPPDLFKDPTWIDDKQRVKQYLQRHQIPVPHFKTAVSLSTGLKMFEEFQSGGLLPVIVKPRSGSRGRHTSTYIASREDFSAAFARAKQLNRYVQIEQHLHGSVCRGTVVHNTLRGFLRGDAPQILGNGKDTVAMLIEQENARRPEKVADIIIQQELTDCISRQGYTLDSVVPEGRALSLLFRTGRLVGGRTKEMLPEVHPKLRMYLEKATQALGVPVVGFDLIISDPTKDPDEQVWGIIEANSLPFIDVHDFALEGEPANVASNIWDLWEPVKTK